MGIGDEILAAGQAERVYRDTGGPVAILDRNGRARAHPLWDHHPAIAQPGSGPMGGLPTVTSGSGCRPYLQYPWKPETGQRFNSWRASDHRGRICFGAGERADAARIAASIGAPFVVIEPNVKPRANPNKDWGLARWQRVVHGWDGPPLVQLGPCGAPTLSGVRRLVTDDRDGAPCSGFRRASAILSHALAYVGAEGALHHAAAALRLPAVVVFGGASSIPNLGYPDHINLGEPEPCGAWLPCDHCKAALDAIAPGHVTAALARIVRLAQAAA